MGEETNTFKNTETENENRIDKIFLSCNNSNLLKSQVLEFYKKYYFTTREVEHGVELISTENIKITSFDNDEIHIMGNPYNFVDLLKDKLLLDKVTLRDPLGNDVLIKFRFNETVKIGILTSGGDAPGMNSVVRAVVRTCIKYGAKIYGIYNGYDGLINDDIRELYWNMETHNSYLGGTTLFSKRSEKFKTQEGIEMAIKNLEKREIDNLIVVGGDGSLKGALSLCKEYKKKNKENKPLNIIGIPGTIDNDIPYADISLGGDSCLNKVLDVIDNLYYTMKSHKRVFVVETMGRDCGWIALSTAFSINADFLLIPELIYTNPSWEVELMQSIEASYENQKPDVFVILSEGAMDSSFKRITLENVVEVIKEKGYEVRGLKMGHFQRGGYTSAHDQLIGVFSGIHAVRKIFLNFLLKKRSFNVMIGHKNNNLSFIELEQVVNDNEDYKKLFSSKKDTKLYKKKNSTFQYMLCKFEESRKMRIKINNFNKRASRVKIPEREEIVSVTEAVSKLECKEKPLYFNNVKSESCLGTFKWVENPTGNKKTVAIIMDGVRAAGMNTCLNTLVEYGVARDLNIVYFYQGYDGIKLKRIQSASIFEFSRNFNTGGAALGSSFHALDGKELSVCLKEMNIYSLIILGGHRNLKIISEVDEDISVFLLPCTSKNNISCLFKSIGSDTALNTISMASISLKLSASTMERTVFLVEIGGDYCSYLTVMGGIASSAYDVIIGNREERFPNNSLDIKKCNVANANLIEKPCYCCTGTGKIEKGFKRVHEVKQSLNHIFKIYKRTPTVIFRNETACNEMATECLCKFLQDSNNNIQYTKLGHLEKGVVPSFIDRANANLMAYRTIDEFLQNFGKGKKGVLGVTGNLPTIFKMDEIFEYFDPDLETVKFPYWVYAKDICRFLEEQ